MKYFTLLSLMVVLLSSNKVASSTDIHNFQENQESRNLSAWGSVMNFIKCPPGPLGKNCSSSSSSNSSRGSWFGGNGSSSGSSSNEVASSEGTDEEEEESSSSSWANWYNGGSGASYGNEQAEEDNNVNGATVVRAGSFPWFIMVFLVVGVSTGGGYMTYQTSKNEEGVASMSTLKEKIAAKFTPDAAAATATNEYALSQDASSAMA